jgi:hypothetical protein
MTGLIFLDKLNISGKPSGPMRGMAFQSEAAGDMWDESLKPLSQETEIEGTEETFLRETYFPTLLFNGGSSANGPTPRILLDIENYGHSDSEFHDAATVADSKAKFLQMIAIWRDVRPDLKIGCYNVAPTPNRDWAIGTIEQKTQWKADQDAFNEVHDALDTLYVTCYAPEIAIWPKADHIEFLNEVFPEARRLGPNKEIFAYVQPYHNSTPFSIIEHEYFRSILDTIKSHADMGDCDGVVFWGFQQTGGSWAELQTAGIVDTINRFVRDWHT